MKCAKFSLSKCVIRLISIILQSRVTFKFTSTFITDDLARIYQYFSTVARGSAKKINAHVSVQFEYANFIMSPQE